MSEQHMQEEVLDPDLVIVDAHHHIWDRSFSPRGSHPFEQAVGASARYLVDDFLADMRTGHNVQAGIYAECRAFYRAGVPAALAPVGEIEFANGAAAMTASGVYGQVRVCHGIVGYANLSLGDEVATMLDAGIAAGNGRLKGIRFSTAHDDDPAVLGSVARTGKHVLASESFRRGLQQLTRRGLIFDAFVLEPQLDELVALARDFPDTKIVLNHAGTPLGIGRYKGLLQERFPNWRDSMKALSKCPNVSVKIGGLGMAFCGFDFIGSVVRPTSTEVAAQWKPYIETCVEAFGAQRCMFESNFPVDKWACDYRTLWNAFKRSVAGASADDKQQLFAETALRTYGLERPDFQ